MRQEFMIILISTAIWFSSQGFAQSPSSLGAFVGKVIPSGPDGVTEIFGVGGVRYSTSGTGASQVDMGAIFGAAGPILWQDVYVNTRYNMKSHSFTNHAGIGTELLRYRSAVTQTTAMDETLLDANGNPILREQTKVVLGLYLLGGVTAELIPPINVRADMKFNFIPDLILTITMGLEWRFGASPGGDPQQ